MKPGDIVEYSSARHGLPYEPPPDTYGILLEHTRLKQWVGGKWQVLWAGQEMTVMAMNLRVVQKMNCFAIL